MSADVVASQLTFTTSPSDPGVVDGADEVVNGQAFATQPVVTAENAQGVTDTDFAESISLTVTPGSLSGTTTKSASLGVADFDGLGVSYGASADGEAFAIQAADAGGGIDPTDASTTGLSADAVATQLAFTTEPSDSDVQDGSDEVVNGEAFEIQPVVTAQDGQGLTDTDFAETVTISVSGSGTISGTTTATASSGVADFDGNALAYTVVSDGESFALQADDASGGVDPAAGTTSSLSADVVTTRLVFTTQPAPLSSRSGEVLDFTTDPVVAAQDGLGFTDLDFNDTITLSQTGVGSASLSGNSVAAVSGVATFAGLTITYSASDPDGESFALQADDTAAGNEGDISDVPTSSSIASITLDFDGQLVAGSSVSEPVTLWTNATDASSAVDIMDFTLIDGGTVDDETLVVTKVTVNTSGAAPLRSSPSFSTAPTPTPPLARTSAAPTRSRSAISASPSPTAPAKTTASART